MTPTFSTVFNTLTKKVKLTDLFNYTTLLFNTAYGNFTCKIGNQTFHTNTQFNANADIVVNTNDDIEIDLPVASDAIRNGSYTFIYDLLINYKSNVVAPSGATFSSIVITPSSAQFISQIQQIVTDEGSAVIQFLNASGTVLGTGVVSGTSGTNTITFASVTIASFASITAINIPQQYQLTKEFAFDSCNTVQSISLNTSVSCEWAQITAQDTTQYPAYVDTLTRTLVLRYPRLASGTEVEPAVTTNEASLTVGPYIWSGGYLISLESVMEWEQTDGLGILQTLTAQDSPDVQCDAGLCNLLTCINSLRVKYMEALKSGSKYTGELFQQNFVVLTMVNTYQIAIQCQNTALAASILTELKSYLNTSTSVDCGCGCGGNEEQNTEPKKIYPLYSNEALINGVENQRIYQ